QLSRAFRERYGLLPHRYVLQRRVQRAVALIETGQCSLAQVANVVGFADQSQMTKVFRKVSGTTPGRVRRGSSGG
ncbi:MAG TPA: AraC family transcriptional regulator, partial [Polyangiaceae bacterium]|nr:AraC family transcriptional regulator [Polyangiaceae bacterium]